MINVTEVKHFKCKCSKCGKTVLNKRGVVDLKENGWLVTKNDIFCPECADVFRELSFLLEEINDTPLNTLNKIQIISTSGGIE